MCGLFLKTSSNLLYMPVYFTAQEQILSEKFCAFNCCCISQHCYAHAGNSWMEMQYSSKKQWVGCTLAQTLSPFFISWDGAWLSTISPSFSSPQFFQKNSAPGDLGTLRNKMICSTASWRGKRRIVENSYSGRREHLCRTGFGSNPAKLLKYLPILQNTGCPIINYHIFHI